jgi:hypothetical protein
LNIKWRVLRLIQFSWLNISVLNIHVEWRECDTVPVIEYFLSWRTFIKIYIIGLEVRVMVFNATFNNISVISWQPVLLVEESRVPGENHWPVASRWQTLSHNVVSSAHVVVNPTTIWPWRPLDLYNKACWSHLFKIISCTSR